MTHDQNFAPSLSAALESVDYVLGATRDVLSDDLRLHLQGIGHHLRGLKDTDTDTDTDTERMVVLNATPSVTEWYRNARRSGMPRHEANFMAAGAAAATDSADVYFLPYGYTIADLRRDLTHPSPEHERVIDVYTDAIDDILDAMATDPYVSDGDLLDAYADYADGIANCHRNLYARMTR